MKRLLLGLTLAVVLMSPVTAQEPISKKAPSASPSDAPSTMTPEIWYYMQQQERWDDPKQAIRRNAEYRASQRRARIESSRWFGYSRLRPQASPIPVMGTASPAWGGNHPSIPYRWAGVQASSLFIHPTVLLR